MTIPLRIRNARLELALAIPTDAPMSVVVETETPLLAPEKTSKVLSTY